MAYPTILQIPAEPTCVVAPPRRVMAPRLYIVEKSGSEVGKEEKRKTKEKEEKKKKQKEKEKEGRNLVSTTRSFISLILQKIEDSSSVEQLWACRSTELSHMSLVV
ncbi:uncharacterized protein LOC111406382 [Olea europaea var. sylvestris]|uniref:uncharacterized protein LOC111406382 n=1 Tax=Olea europaea var. sylvestris TaxID=158386 RepID=UPI000C1D3D9E|nr:uncharacterized protein LOC111406382 [Olea europaea var. sylvestris]